MHVKPSISLLAFALAGLLSQDVLALPFDQPGGIIHLPLNRVEQRRGDVHPQILHQQYVNRAYRRLARMTGRAEPSDIELRNKLIRRIEFLERSQPELLSRYNHSPLYNKGRKQNINQDSANDGSSSVVAPDVTVTVGESPTASVSACTDITVAGPSGAVNDAANTASATGTDTAAAAATDATVVTPANPPSAKDSLGLDIDNIDESFHATIQIGTPPRNFRVIMDSGSADFWVGSENCKDENGGTCGNHNFLGNRSSSTFVDSGEAWNITYGTGGVNGTKVTDNISIAGLSLANHKFGVSINETDNFANNSAAFDGILGTAQSTLSEQGNLTPVEALADKKLIAFPITSYKIPRLADGKNDGVVTFGGLDPTKFDPATLVTLNNVSPKGFWEASIGDVSVSGTSLGLEGRTGILDTGTTLIFAPVLDAIAVHKRIPDATPVGDGSFTIPCNSTVSVALTFGGTVFAIDSRDLALLPADPANPGCICMSGIVGADIGKQTKWLLGDVFLKNAYFSHDVKTNKISLAKLV